MAVPKRKTSPGKRNQRRKANSNIRNAAVSENATTGELHRPHHVSPDGYYKGRQVTEAKVNV